jgi:hypothetical protein
MFSVKSRLDQKATAAVEPNLNRSAVLRSHLGRSPGWQNSRLQKLPRLGLLQPLLPIEEM